MTGGSYGAKSLGRVSLQQIETRRSQRRTDKARANHELKVLTVDLKSRPSRARTVRVNSSRTDRTQAHDLPEVQEDGWITHQHTSINLSVTESDKSFVGVKEHMALKKIPTTPVTSKRVEFDIVTPKQEDIESLQEAGAAGGPSSPLVDAPGSQHNKSKGKLNNPYMYSTVHASIQILLVLEKVEHCS